MNDADIAENARQVLSQSKDIATPEEKIVIFKTCTVILENIREQETIKMMTANNIRTMAESILRK